MMVPTVRFYTRGVRAVHKTEHLSVVLVPITPVIPNTLPSLYPAMSQFHVDPTKAREFRLITVDDLSQSILPRWIFRRFDKNEQTEIVTALGCLIGNKSRRTTQADGNLAKAQKFNSTLS